MKCAINGVITEIPDEEFVSNITPTDEIEHLKQCLFDTDYKAIKFAEGEISAAEYAETKAQRCAWRAQINQLESEL